MISKFKKLVKKILGFSSYVNFSSFIRRRFFIKKKTKKPIAFLFGFSSWKISFVKEYLPEFDVKMYKNKSFSNTLPQIERFKDKVFIVWGMNEKDEVRNYAKKRNVPLYRMEDGFIRSIGLGANHTFPMSLCLDDRSIYYNAKEESQLENLLNNYNFQSDSELLGRARYCMNQLNELKLSKYNHVENIGESYYGPKKKTRILVIGQVETDASIKMGCNKIITNNDLVWIARVENPEAEIYYKPHPDVLNKKRGILSDPKDVEHICHVITEPLSLSDALETIDHVYTITSLSGFEALIRGIKVTTLGAPFYSGWGLTDDRQKVSRRKRRLSVEEVFAAAYILYPRYMNPFTKENIEIEDAIELLGFMKEKEDQKNLNEIKNMIMNNDFSEHPVFNINEFDEILAGSKIGIFANGIMGIDNIDSFLTGELIFDPAPNTVELVVGWGKKETAKPAIEFSKRHNIPYISLEDGFLRSTGLGVDGSPPYSMIFDNVGIYYDATSPSRLERILNTSGWEDRELLKQATRALSLITEHKLSKYNHAPDVEDNLFVENNKKRILVVDQTFGDKSVTLGLANENSFEVMLRTALNDNPGAEIYVKTHPDVIAGKKRGYISNKIKNQRITLIGEDINPLSLLEKMDEVYVVTSQMGFEALMLSKKVKCFGLPFYAGWGVTEDLISCPRRNRKRSVLEIFAAAYMLYPKYTNPDTNQPGDIFDVIDYLIEYKNTTLEWQKVEM